MSAICGIVHYNQAPFAAQRCHVVQDALAPYGSAAEGRWDGQHVALGSRLSRLLPEDEYDRQPLFGGDGRFVLVADLRLDNRAALGARLRLPGSRLKTMADADVLLVAYERWGTQTPAQLVGEFAFAVWDKQERSLFLARDHLGRRPLFYYRGKGYLGFSSMPRGLLALPDVSSAPDQQRIKELMFNVPFSAPDGSYFSDLRRLPAGHSASVRADGTFSTTRYWTLPTEERITFTSDDDYVDAFIEKLDEAVRCRLRSHGNVASLISGGFDSATVSSVAARLLAETGQSLDAYTAIPNPIGLPTGTTQVLNEGPLAAQVASLFPNIRHHQIRTDDESIVAMLEATYAFCNCPIKNVGNLPWYIAIGKLAAQRGASTLLVGDLGNFSVSYRGDHALNALLREGRLNALGAQLSLQMQGLSYRRRLSVMYRMVKPSLPDKWQFWLEHFLSRSPKADARQETGIQRAVLETFDFHRYSRTRASYANTTAILQESRRHRRAKLLHGDTSELRKGMHALSGVETRDPTTDIRLIQYCQAIPVEQFAKDGTTGWLLRRALARYWPADIVASRTRGRQSADLQYKMRRETDALTAEIALFNTSPIASTLLDIDVLKRKLATVTNACANAEHPDNVKLIRLIAIGHFLRKTAQSAIGAE